MSVTLVNFWMDLCDDCCAHFDVCNFAWLGKGFIKEGTVIVFRVMVTGELTGPELNTEQVKQWWKK